MAAGQKPDFSLSIKAVTADRADRPSPLAAYWREPDGRLGGGLDKTITRMKIQYADGTVVDVVRTNGKTSHWVNLREWTGAGARPSKPAAVAESWGGTESAADDEIPF